jgi:hypothetical protein
LAEQARRPEVPDLSQFKGAKPRDASASLDLHQFQVVAAFAERVFCEKYAKMGGNVIKMKEYVEIADFERLGERISRVDISDELRNLLVLVKKS